jgi:hypothetical protein
MTASRRPGEQPALSSERDRVGPRSASSVRRACRRETVFGRMVAGHLLRPPNHHRQSARFEDLEIDDSVKVECPSEDGSRPRTQPKVPPSISRGSGDEGFCAYQDMDCVGADSRQQPDGSAGGAGLGSKSRYPQMHDLKRGACRGFEGRYCKPSDVVGRPQLQNNARYRQIYNGN